MAYKTLLTVLPMTETSHALNPAIDLAIDFGAHLDIIVMGELLNPSDYFYASVGEDTWREHNINVYKQTEALVSEVEAKMQKKGVSGNVMAERQFPQMTSEVLSRYALMADLNVIPIESLKSASSMIHSYYRALVMTGRPTMIQTETPFNLKDPRPVLVAWDASPEAALAVHQSLPILKTANAVDLLIIEPEELDLGEHPGNDIAVMLARHGVKVTVKPQPRSKPTIAATLRQHAADTNAKIIIMGAYGTTRIKAWLFGTVTQEMVEKSAVPLFFSHR